jgi:hypothetical protein
MNGSEGKRMKTKVCTTALIVFLLLLLINVGTTKAGNPDYSLVEYSDGTPATIDGEWTTDDEWTDAPITEMSDNANFGYNVYPNDWIMQWIVEIFDDDTDDAGDYWQICIDDLNNGVSTPQSGDYRVDIVGHTNLVFYEGNGQGWDEITPDSGEIEWADSIDGSPTNTNPHWILELAILKTIRIATNAPPTGMRVAYYDASNSAAGVQAWPPDSDRDIPDEWGVISEFSEDPYNKVATPTFSPAAGTYSSAQSVSISCSTSGATIRYTTDGADPTSSSPIYTNPISVTSGSVTVKARAFESGWNDSEVASATYTIQSTEQVATPTFFPAPGFRPSALPVSISCTTPDATIRYTLDGSTPTASSTIYTDPISVTSGSVTIKAKAFKDGMADSEVATATYTIVSRDYERVDFRDDVEPTIDGFWTSPDEWTGGEVTMIGENVAFRSVFTVYMIDDSWASTVHFVIEILNDNTDDAGDYWQICIDGLLNGGSTPQVDDFRIDIVGHDTLRVYQGNGAGWTEITPDPSDVTFANSISASPTSSTPHRVLEISMPKNEGVIYMFYVYGIRVAAYDESNSAAGVQAWPPDSDRDVPDDWGINNFNLDLYDTIEKVAAPTFSPAAGTYSSAQSVTISCSTSDATIRYTLDGSTPTSSSTVYTDPISVGSGSVTVKAKAFKDGMTDSNFASATYTIQLPQVATPTFSPAAGTYSSAQSVSISCSTSGATIRYTTDGADPTSSSPIYTNPISVTSGSVTVKARAFKSGWNDSEVASATYTIQLPQQVATPTFSPAPDTYSSAQSVTISCSTSDATIRYTLDGSTPTSSSTVYTNPISVGSSSVTVKARAFKDGMTDSNVASGTYTIGSDPIAISVEWVAAIISLCGLTAGAGGWIFRSYSARKRHKILFTKLMEDIDDIYTRFKMNTLRCETELYRYKNQVLEDFKQGLIDEEKYNVLDKRIDNYLKEIEEEKTKERQS